MTPAVQSCDGFHLGFVPVFHWRDLTGAAHVHHGNIYRSEAEARRGAHRPAPASWASWTVEINRCSTRFESGPVIRSDKTISELIFGAASEDLAA